MDILSREFPVDMSGAGLYPSDTVDEAVGHAMGSVLSAYTDRSPVCERLEFVAKRLLYWESDHRWDYLAPHEQPKEFESVEYVLLGTPIYVAMVA